MSAKSATEVGNVVTASGGAVSHATGFAASTENVLLSKISSSAMHLNGMKCRPVITIKEEPNAKFSGAGAKRRVPTAKLLASAAT